MTPAEALDRIQDALHEHRHDEEGVIDLRPAFKKLNAVLTRAHRVRDGWFVATPVTPEEVARFILTGETEEEVTDELAPQREGSDETARQLLGLYGPEHLAAEVESLRATANVRTGQLNAARGHADEAKAELELLRAAVTRVRELAEGAQEADAEPWERPEWNLARKILRELDGET